MQTRPSRHLIRTLTYAGATAFVLVASGSAAAQQRFGGLDRNGDGVITRSEWRGSDRSFGNHDWNRDGVLSGDEIRSALASRQPQEDAPWGAGLSDWTEDRFGQLDRNRDGRLSEQEWSADPGVFARVDANGDRTISRREFLGLEYDTTTPWGEPEDEDDADAIGRFDEFDRNGDGVITMDEWPRTERAFRRRDTDRSGAIEPGELPAAPRQQANAYRSGYERGMADGRTAGREDKTRRNRWDLEGQRELESADAGYTSGMGRRQDYQAGYRAGFRVGYADGFGTR